MPWDVDDRRFRQVDKTVADVGSQPTEGGRDAGKGSLDLDVTTRRKAGAAGAPAGPAPSPAGDLEVTRLASARREAFRVAEKWAGAATSPGGVALVPPEGSASEPFAIVVRDEFRIGRSTNEVDFVTWFLPRSGRNDALTRRISRVHATIAAEGPRLWISDCGTTNGTSLDSVLVRGRAAVPLASHTEVVLAGEYKLVVDPLPVPFPNLEVEGLPPAPKDVPCGAVRFHAADGPGPSRNPIWLFRQVAFGTGRGCGMRFPDDALAEVHGVFCLFGGVVWIGVVAPEAGVALDGVGLTQGELAPILGCGALRIGRFEYAIEAL